MSRPGQKNQSKANASGRKPARHTIGRKPDRINIQHDALSHRVADAVLLSGVHEQKQAAGDQEAMAAIASLSPVAWQHVNLFGTFEFSSATSKADIAALVARYADPACWSKVLQ